MRTVEFGLSDLLLCPKNRGTLTSSQTLIIGDIRRSKKHLGK